MRLRAGSRTGQGTGSSPEPGGRVALLTPPSWPLGSRTAGECRRLVVRRSVCGNPPQRPWQLNTRPFPFPASVSATVK